MKRIATAASCALMMLLCASAGFCASQPLVTIVSPNGEQRASVRVEIANTEKERETGLMFRSHLEEDAGMIFIFAAPSRFQFWMKNTRIPLDMIFADQNGRIVGIVADAKPYSTRLLGVGVPSQYVLEVNGGFCRRHGIAVGDWVRFSGFTPHAGD